MGTSAKTLSRFISLHQRGLLKNGASIIELGAQELYCTNNEKHVRDVIRYFSDNNHEIKKADDYTDAEIKTIANKGMFGKMVKACGFKYQALDIFEAENTTLFDLNIQSPGEDMIEKYDMVTNFGTTEHVINQYLSMKTMHELAKPGGLIFHELPLSGYHYHGYFSYNPLLFHHLADANGYTIILQSFSKGSATSAPGFMTENGYPEKDYFDYGIEIIFQKNTSAPFRMPLETSTSLGLSKSLWQDDNPYSGNEARFGSNSGSFTANRSLANVSGWDLQRELILRYRRKLAKLLGLS